MKSKEEFYKKIGSKIRQRREALGFSMDQLSQMAGLNLSRSSISYMELGQQEISVLQLSNMCFVLGLKQEDLLSDKQPFYGSIEVEESNGIFNIKKNKDSTSERKIELTKTELLDLYLKIKDLIIV